MSLIDDLHEVAFVVTPLIVKPEFSHMAKAWEMVLGGLIAPAMKLEDPKSIEENAYFQELLTKYNPEAIRAFFAPKVIETEKVVEKTVERIVEIKVPVAGKEGETRIIKVPVTDSLRGGKYRRIKTDVVKTKRFERDLNFNDRNVIISWWNKEQHQVLDDDPVCAELAAQIDKVYGLEPLSPLQVAGYFSHLARMATWDSVSRQKRIERYIKQEVLTIPPVFSDALCKAVKEAKELRDTDKKVRTEAHREILSKRLVLDGALGVHTVTETLPPEAPKAVTDTAKIEEVIKAVESPEKKDDELVSSFEAEKTTIPERAAPPVITPLPVSKPATDEELDIEIKFA